MNILVIGGDGFLGSHLVDVLAENDHRITVLDRFPYNATRNLEHIKDKVTLVSGEFANRVDLRDTMAGNEIVFHFAWASTPITSWKDPYLEIDENIRHSVQMCEVAAEVGVKKIVFPSSGGTVYGPQSGPVSEMCPPKPFCPYGIAKLSVEHFLSYFREATGIASDVYRIGNAFGPRQPVSSPQGVISVWMSKILSQEKITAYGDDRTLRDYVYVKDIAEVMTYSLQDVTRSETFNLGTGQGTSIIGLLNIFKEVVDVPFEYELLPRRPSDNRSIVLDNSLILSCLEGFDFGDLKDHISETWQFLKEQQAAAGTAR